MATSFLSHMFEESATTQPTEEELAQPNAAADFSSPVLDRMQVAGAAEVAELLQQRGPSERAQLMEWLQQHRGNAFVQEVVGAGNAAPAFGAPAAEEQGFRPWPMNGRVINNSKRAVKVWSDSKGEYEIPPGESSGALFEDVDHVQDASGQWWKIGANTVTIDEEGYVHNAKCRAEMGQDCS
jgi:hypothetical protein